jgi:ribosome-associated protein
VRSVADRIMEVAKAEGIRLLHSEGMDQGRWVLLDFGDVVVHIFGEETREYYRIEELWADARRVPLDIAA